MLADSVLDKYNRQPNPKTILQMVKQDLQTKMNCISLVDTGEISVVSKYNVIVLSKLINCIEQMLFFICSDRRLLKLLETHSRRLIDLFNTEGR